ncbi:MAG: NUDIX domain-containing protein [Candidatus Spechtbacterales bacterium]|nr:NUDIX domain-containing protein [Candidatus Spechtbacterales bacterium]
MSQDKSINEYSFGIIPARKVGGDYYFLLVHRLEGFWELPKGHAEEDEDDIEAAKREFSEETGLQKVNILKDSIFENKYIYERDDEVIHKVVKYYIGLVPEGEEVRVQKDEVDDYTWAPFEEARRIITHQNSRELLDKAFEALEENYK